MHAETRPTILRGLLMAGSAYLIFTVQDVLVRLLVKADMPIWQVLLMRSLCIVVICLCMKGPSVVVESMASPSRLSLVARGVSSGTATSFGHLCAQATRPTA